MQLLYIGPGLDILPLFIGQNFENENSDIAMNISEIFLKMGNKKKILKLFKKTNSFIFIDVNEFQKTKKDLLLYLNHMIFKMKCELENFSYSINFSQNLLSATFGVKKQKLKFYFKTNAFDDIIKNNKILKSLQKTNILYLCGMIPQFKKNQKKIVQQIFLNCHYFCIDCPLTEANDYLLFIKKIKKKSSKNNIYTINCDEMMLGFTK